MLSRESASSIACSFLVAYYRDFVREQSLLSLIEFYAENSQIIYAGYNEETPEIVQGKHDITMHLMKLDSTLGRRKIDVRFVDSVPLPNGLIHILCQGILYLRGQRQAFFQSFVLSPTQYRTCTYHVVNDYFRVIVVELEHIPDGGIIMTPAEVAQHLLEEQERQHAEETRKQQEQERERQEREEREREAAEGAVRRAQAQQSRAQAHEGPERARENGRSSRGERGAEAKTGDGAPPRRRDRRDRRERRERREPREAAETGTRAAAAQSQRRGGADGGPAARAAPRAKQQSQSPQQSAAAEAPVRSGSTNFVRFARVPKSIEHTEIAQAAQALVGAEPRTSYWFGRSKADCVLELVSAAAAEKLMRTPLMVQKTPLTAVAFYP